MELCSKQVIDMYAPESLPNCFLYKGKLNTCFYVWLTVTKTFQEAKQTELVSDWSLVYSLPLPRLWSDYQYGSIVALAVSVVCHTMVAGQVSCLCDGRAGARSVHQRHVYSSSPGASSCLEMKVFIIDFGSDCTSVSNLYPIPPCLRQLSVSKPCSQSVHVSEFISVCVFVCMCGSVAVMYAFPFLFLPVFFEV